MSILEIEQTVIDPLTLEEKRELHAYLARELKRAEFAAKLKHAEEMYISPGFEIDPEAALKLHGRDLTSS
ncbi:MAG: hypothetical protein GY794_25435 [bacterium]|nr:hypothetical protein [bacterium]